MRKSESRFNYSKKSNLYFNQPMKPHESILNNPRELSDFNFLERGQAGSEFKPLYCKAGDICYIDFGQAYLYEAGYQHMGLVIGKFYHKVFVLPITSNEVTFEKAMGYDSPHLYPLGKVGRLRKNMTLFLNDAKFINPARIIQINGHLDINGPLFIDIKERLNDILSFGNQIEQTMQQNYNDDFEL